MKKTSWLRRLIYFLAGVAGLYAIFWAIFSFDIFIEMPFFAIVAYIVMAIASLNWIPVSFNNDGNKDLLHYLGLKK